MASSTRSTSSVNSVPAIASNFGGGPTRTACNCFTLPFSSPVNLMLLMLQSRMPPSSCALSVRSCSGQSGHGVEAARCLGRLGHDLELVHALCALAMAGAEAVGAGVAAANDQHALACGE